MDRFAAAQKIKSRVTYTIVATSGVSRVVIVVSLCRCVVVVVELIVAEAENCDFRPI